MWSSIILVLAISQATVLANPVAQDSVDFVAQYPEYASDLTNSVAQYADDSTTQCTRTSNAVSDQISVDENPAEDQILSILPRKTPDTACPAKGTFRFTPQGKPTLRPIFKFRKYREDRIHKLRRLQLKPDPFCKGHGSKKQLLTCGGPEIMGEYLSVVHCIRGMNPFVPTRGIWVATKKVALYCCQFFFDIEKLWLGDTCDRMTPNVELARYDQNGFDYYFNQRETNARNLGQYDEDDYLDSGYGYEENPEDGYEDDY